ncbi:amidase [Roseibium alexandrii]|uniref:amidase n=1 Tax=Roseibium alexandrii TaxID=388408 RepID=UPI0037527AF0
MSEDRSGQSGINRREVLALGGVAAATAVSGPKAFAASFEANELTYMTASELLPLFRAGKLSPVEVLEAQIASYEAVNDKVNCVTYTHFDTALVAARDSEQRYMDGTARALEGISVAVKDEHHDAGWIVTQGSKLLADNKMDAPDVIVSRLKAAGCVLPIQTTVPELYLSGVTWSKLWGVTRNPWNLEYAVGGSSGGSGAALAAGMATLATGSDMGGSIRIPAHFGALYGFKPPVGRIPSGSLQYFLGSGPLTRGFDDMVMMQNVMAGPSFTAPHVGPKLDMPFSYPGIAGMKIAYVESMGLAPVDEDTKAAMAQGVETLTSLGAIVDTIEVDPGFGPDEVGEIFSKGGLGGPVGGDMIPFADRLDEMTSYGASFVKKAASGKYNGQTVSEFEQIVFDFYRRLGEQVYDKGYEAIVMPTICTPHVPADYDISKGGLVVDGQDVHPFGILALTAPWNFLNWCPVVDVPVSLSSKGVPIGMQIIGKSYEDMEVFRIAHAYAGRAKPMFTGDRFPDYRAS